MKVLLVLAAIGVLGGNALPTVSGIPAILAIPAIPAISAIPEIPAIPAIPAIPVIPADLAVSESELVTQILVDGHQIATDMVAMMDGAINLSELQLNQYLTGHEDFISSLTSIPKEFASANYADDIVQQCVDEHREEAVPIHEKLRENLRGCVAAARAEVKEVRQNVTHAALKVRAHGVQAFLAVKQCKSDNYGIPVATIQCVLQKATPQWRHKVATSVRNLGASVRVGMSNVRAAAIEGRDCAVTNLVKARDGLTAVAQEVVQCINDKANGNLVTESVTD